MAASFHLRFPRQYRYAVDFSFALFRTNKIAIYSFIHNAKINILDSKLSILGISKCYSVDFVYYSSRCYDKLLQWESNKKPFDVYIQEKCKCVTAFPFLTRSANLENESDFIRTEDYIQNFITQSHPKMSSTPNDQTTKKTSKSEKVTKVVRDPKALKDQKNKTAK